MKDIELRILLSELAEIQTELTKAYMRADHDGIATLTAERNEKENQIVELAIN